MNDDYLPEGYQEDDVFDINIVNKNNTSDLSGYSSDDGGDFKISNQQIPFDIIEESSSSEYDNKPYDTYFKDNQHDQWNERFQSLVESAYFRKGEDNYSAVRQYELSLALRQLCVDFATEASNIGVEIVKQMVIKSNNDLYMNVFFIFNLVVIYSSK